MTQTVTEFWQEFLSAMPEIPKDTPYQTWYFGNSREMALELAQLVIGGRKTATGSLAAVNAIKPDEAPVLGGFSIVTDHDGAPMCVIKTTEITDVPFLDVDASFAHDEGEGDQSLEWWRRAHQAYFQNEAAELGLEFNERSLVCCERFKLLFPK
jgi:uncharacterized protein YhfF